MALRFLGGIAVSALVAFGVLVCMISVVSCSPPEPVHPRTCIEYATKLVLACQVLGDDRAADCTVLYEQAYNACNIALESGTPVCMPYGHTGRCDGYVLPPAPANWRGVAEPSP